MNDTSLMDRLRAADPARELRAGAVSRVERQLREPARSSRWAYAVTVGVVVSTAAWAAGMLVWRAEPSPPPAPVVSTPPPARAVAPSSLEAEARALDGVVRALTIGNVAEANERLDRYAREFPEGGLRPEAEQLRRRAVRGASK